MKNPLGIATVSEGLAAGNLIVYPTETLYGIGCDALAPGAPMEKVARLKHRPAEQPFLFLVPDRRYLEENGIPLPETGQKLAKRFWPGPLTLILPVPSASPLTAIAFRGSLAVRVSPHPFVNALFRHRRFPLVSTSANISGAPEDDARDPERIRKNFSDGIALFVTEGVLKPSPPSTLVDLRSSPPKLAREGALPFAKIAASI